MIRAIRPNAMAQDDAALVTGWNISPNVAYTIQLNPGSSACGVLVYSEDQTAIIASGAGLVGTDQPVILHPYSGQTIGMVDADLGWHLLLTTDGTEYPRTIKIGPAVDLPDEIHPIYADDALAVIRATAGVNAAAHYIDDLSVTCPLGLGAGLGDVASVPVDGSPVVGQVESITWTGAPSGAIESAVIRRHVAIAPEPWVDPVPITPPTVADDTAETNAETEASGNVLANDKAGLTVVAVNGLSANVAAAVAGDNGGVFTISSTGAWVFDPDGDFGLLTGSQTAETSVTYHASDGVGEAMATLTVTVSSGVQELWTPSAISTALWLDAADALTITQASGFVSQWADKSGNNRHAAQASASAKPQALAAGLNGLNVLNFDQGDYMLTPNIFTSASDVSVFLVHRSSTTNSGGRAVFALQNSLNVTNGFFHALCRTDITNGFRSFFSTDSSISGALAKSPPTPFSTGTWFIYGHGRSAAAQFLSWIGQNSESAVSGQCNFSNAKGIVGGYYGSAYLWHGVIAEIIVCPAYVDATTIQKIEGYLAHKWGLTGSLPSDHPYKTVAPTI